MGRSTKTATCQLVICLIRAHFDRTHFDTLNYWFDLYFQLLGSFLAPSVQEAK